MLSFHFTLGNKHPKYELSENWFIYQIMTANGGGRKKVMH
jgi:hypothetical protein